MTNMFQNVIKNKYFTIEIKINHIKDVRLYKLIPWYTCIKNVKNFTLENKKNYKPELKNLDIKRKIYKIFIIIL